MLSGSLAALGNGSVFELLLQSQQHKNYLQLQEQILQGGGGKDS